MGVPDFQPVIISAQAAPDLSGLPGWAQVLGYSLFVIGVAAAGVIARYGFKRGSAAPASESPKSAAVAAVIVDPEALNRATAAALKLDETLGRLTDLVGQHVADQREEREDREIEEEVDRRVEQRLRARRTRRPAVPRAK